MDLLAGRDGKARYSKLHATHVSLPCATMIASMDVDAERPPCNTFSTVTLSFGWHSGWHRSAFVESDVLAVIANPSKGPEASDFGRVNVWGYGANGVRIRVTFHPASGEIRTVAIADRRFSS